jgi:hypothetical protein
MTEVNDDNIEPYTPEGLGSPVSGGGSKRRKRGKRNSRKSKKYMKRYRGGEQQEQQEQQQEQYQQEEQEDNENQGGGRRSRKTRKGKIHIGKKHKGKVSKWITHVKNYSRANKIDFRQALRDPKCKASYHKMK